MTSLNSQERTSAALAAIPEQESLVAVFVAQNGARATVNQGTRTITVPTSMQYPLIPGDPVRLERRNGQLVMLGPSVPRSATGRVTVTGAPRCTVEYPDGSGVTAQMGYNPSYTPAVNDIVLIGWDAGGGTILFKPSTVPSPLSPTVAPPVGPSVYHPAPFAALDSGSYGARGWNTADVYASDSYIGAWFYGSKIKDTIPDGAVISAARIFLPITQSFGAAPLLGTHTSASKPGGGVAISSAAALSPRAGWVDIPLTFLDFLKANDGGLGFNHGGYNIYRGVNADGLSGALDVTYTA